MKFQNTSAISSFVPDFVFLAAAKNWGNEEHYWKQQQRVQNCYLQNACKWEPAY